MIRLLAVVVFFLSSVPAFAMPQFLERYRRDPFRNPAQDGCITCHMSAEGGDARNPFGQAFESGGEEFTPMLRAQFPDRFVYPVSRVSDALIIHFSDPEKKQIVVETGGMKNLVDADKRMVNGTPATNTTSPVTITRPAESQTRATRSEIFRMASRRRRVESIFSSAIDSAKTSKPPGLAVCSASIAVRRSPTESGRA
jgi:hypothetical protein